MDGFWAATPRVIHLLWRVRHPEAGKGAKKSAGARLSYIPR